MELRRLWKLERGKGRSEICWNGVSLYSIWTLLACVATRRLVEKTFCHSHNTTSLRTTCYFPYGFGSSLLYTPPPQTRCACYETLRAFPRTPQRAFMLCACVLSVSPRHPTRSFAFPNFDGIVMGVTVPERTPREVGTPFPVSPQIPPETYTYDYIIVGGANIQSNSVVLSPIIVCRWHSRLRAGLQAFRRPQRFCTSR